MALITFTRDDDVDVGFRGIPGTWTIVRIDDEPVPVITCPECRQAGKLRRHTIASDGTVTPSVVCAHEGCPFHEWARLEGWEPLT